MHALFTIVSTMSRSSVTGPGWLNATCTSDHSNMHSKQPKTNATTTPLMLPAEIWGARHTEKKYAEMPSTSDAVIAGPQTFPNLH